VYYIDDTGNAIVQLSIGQSNTGIFEWDFDDGTTESSTGDIVHAYLSPGTYDITVTGCMTNCLPQNTCADQIVSIQVIDTTSSLVVATGDSIIIFPNPASDRITMSIPDALERLTLQITDINGIPVLTQSVLGGTHEIYTDLPAGMYMLRFMDPETGTIYKAIRQVVHH
jgi:hypothetical protein